MPLRQIFPLNCFVSSIWLVVYQAEGKIVMTCVVSSFFLFEALAEEYVVHRRRRLWRDCWAASHMWLSQPTMSGVIPKSAIISSDDTAFYLDAVDECFGFILGDERRNDVGPLVSTWIPRCSNSCTIVPIMWHLSVEWVVAKDCGRYVVLVRRCDGGFEMELGVWAIKFLRKKLVSWKTMWAFNKSFGFRKEGASQFNLRAGPKS